MFCVCVIGLVKLGREIEIVWARFPFVQELYCALSHSVICLCVSGLYARFTLSTHIQRKVNTVIKAFKIEFISFGKKKRSQNTYFWKNSTLAFLGKKIQKGSTPHLVVMHTFPMAEQGSFMSQNWVKTIQHLNPMGHTLSFFYKFI